MADVENGDILRIGATWTVENLYEITNVWHALVTAGGGIGYAAAALDVQDYMEDIYTEMLHVFTDDEDTDFLTLSNPSQVTTFGAIAWQAPLVGTNAADKTAMGVCLFGWARTLKPRVQIRKYWGVLTEGDLADGAWNGTARAAADAAMAIHIAPYAAGPALTLQGVAYNRTLDTYVEPISRTTSAEPAYQRRRKRGRGS